LLTKLRNMVKHVIVPIAKFFISCNFTATHLTIIGLMIAVPIPLVAYLKTHIWLIPLLILLSAFFDAIDGEVARITGKVSSLGAFIDSTVDRIEDSIYIVTLLFLGFSEVPVITLLILSLLISYVRARAEGLGLNLEGVGFIERGDRVLFLFLITALYILNEHLSLLLLYLLIILSLITLIQRIYFVAENLTNRRCEKS